MHTSLSFSFRIILAMLCLGLAQPSPAQEKNGWLPLGPQDLAASKPQVEPDADAEILLWQVRLVSSSEAVKMDNYIRLKIFTERGRELNSKISLPFSNLSRFEAEIKDIAARTIAPDGSIVEVKPQDIYENEQVRVRGFKSKVKTFALPNLKVGSIVEYRWRESRIPTQLLFFPGLVRLAFFVSASGERFEVQREFPVRQVTYYINPDSSRPLTAKVFNWPQQPVLVKQGSNYTFTLNNIPAVREEPFMPPDEQTQAWFMYYERKEVTPTALLSGDVQGHYRLSKEAVRQTNNGDFKRIVQGVVGDEVDPMAKLRLIFTYCQTKIKNMDNPAQQISEKEQKEYRFDFTLPEIVKHGLGNSLGISAVFAGMAQMAGFETRLALIPNRRRAFFDFTFPRSELLSGDRVVAVKVGEEWRFFQPSDPYASFTRLRWEHEGVVAIIPQEKDALTIPTLISSSDKSQSLRTARVAVSEDGTLAGEVEIIYSGHRAVALKEDYAETSPIERERDWTANLKQRLGAEITQFKMEGIAANNDPVKITFHLRAVNYAQRTGKRMFLPVAVFQHGLGAVFPGSQRKYDIYFPYAWQETDNLTFTLPTGYALDTPTVPPNLETETMRYRVQISHTSDQKQLTYRRHFVLGIGPQKNLLFYGPETYPVWKKFFDEVHQKDEHVIVLRRNEN